MTLIEFVQLNESKLLAAAALAYLAGMLLLWTQLFFKADDVSRRSQVWHQKAAHWGNGILALGATLHLLSLVGQGPQLFSIRVGVVGLFGWILATGFLMFGRHSGRGMLGAFISPLVLLAALYSLAASSLHKATASAQLETQWLVLHVVIILIGYGALALAFAASLLYLLQDGLLKRKQLAGLWQRLPSLQVADDLIYRGTVFGLAMLTLGIVTGVAWMQRHQSGYVIVADPKVLFTVITWLTFALYLAARWWLGWRGRRTNFVVIFGFVFLVISFFGAPHVLSGVAR